jgi:drug/metabolite transporter superfamily protein YnfA
MTDTSKRKKILTLTLFFFFLAGLCEIGGGDLVWLWLREDTSWVLGVIAGFVLFLYDSDFFSLHISIEFMQRIEVSL